MLAYGDDRAYGGNEGYSDSADRYSFDSRVPNWKQVGRGDLAVIAGRLTRRGAPEVTGFAEVQRVTSANGKKTIRRCPECGQTRFKARTTKDPTWRCGNGHEFEVPVEEVVDAALSVAWFDGTYRPAIGAMTSRQLKAAQVNAGDGNSIRPLKVAVVRQSFLWDPAFGAVVDPGGYPDPAAAAKVDRAALPLATAIVQARYPGATVAQQDHGNPGFDFLVTLDGSTIRYVELKSTTRTSGRFFMSEYQRAFSADNGSRYSLLVLAALDIEKETCDPHWFDGAVDDHFALDAIQWRGAL